MTSPGSRQSRNEEEVVGQALLDLSARLPEGYRRLGNERGQATMYVSYDAGDEVWEIEFCALDPSRNFVLQDRSLPALMERAIARDRETAPDV